MAGNKKTSKGQLEVDELLRSVLPNQTIEYEHHLGEQLFLDIYVPNFKLGVEYHGRQHFEYIPFFHGDYHGYEQSVYRDRRKLLLAAEQGIAVVVVRYDEQIDEVILFDKIQAAMAEVEPVEAPAGSSKDWKKKARERFKKSDEYKRRKEEQRQFRLRVRKDRDNKLHD